MPSLPRGMGRIRQHEQREQARRLHAHTHAAGMALPMGVLLALLVAALALNGGGAHAHRPRSLLRLPVCRQSELIRPLIPGEVVRNMMGVPTAGVIAAGACIQLRGNVTLVQISSDGTSMQVFSLTGTVTFWWAGSTQTAANACATGTLTPEATTAASNAFFRSLGLLVGGSAWSQATCCTGDCSGTDANVTHSPLLAAGSPPSDWLTLRGYALAGAAGAQPYPLSPSLHDAALSAQPNATGCQQVCAGVPGCASYQFNTTAQRCAFSTSEPGPALAVAPCPSPDECVLGVRVPGPCNASASPGISFYGKRWAGWKPGLERPSANSSVPPGAWSSAGINATVQGRAALTPSQCNCRCAAVGACVGYVWLAGERTCWLFSSVQPALTPEDDPDPGTVLGRLVQLRGRAREAAARDGGSAAPGPFACRDPPALLEGATVLQGSSHRIAARMPLRLTYPQCYASCAAEPACQVAGVSGVPSSSNASSAAAALMDCFLFSEASGGVVPASNASLLQLQRCQSLPEPRIYPLDAPPRVGWNVAGNVTVPSQTLLGLLTSALSNSSVPNTRSAQACYALCRATPGCGVVVFNPATRHCVPAFLAAPALAPAYSLATPQRALELACGDAAGAGAGACVVASRAAGRCGFITSSGVLALGQAWKGWAPGVKLGTWGSAFNIEDSKQGLPASSASDCACSCLLAPACISYVFLGDLSQCWLQNRVDFSVGFQQDASPTTLTARVAVPTGFHPRCTDPVKFEPDQVSLSLGAGAIQRRPNPFTNESLSMAGCNTACLLEPFCLAWLFSPAAAADDGASGAAATGASCQLFSSVNNTGESTTFPGGFFGYVQRCPLDADASESPIIPRSLPPDLIWPSPPNAGPSTSRVDGTNVGIGIGIALGAVVVAAAAVAVAARVRRNRRAAAARAGKGTAEESDRQLAIEGALVGDPVPESPQRASQRQRLSRASGASSKDDGILISGYAAAAARALAGRNVSMQPQRRGGGASWRARRLSDSAALFALPPALGDADVGNAASIASGGVPVVSFFPSLKRAPSMPTSSVDALLSAKREDDDGASAHGGTRVEASHPSLTLQVQWPLTERSSATQAAAVSAAAAAAARGLQPGPILRPDAMHSTAAPRSESQPGAALWLPQHSEHADPRTPWRPQDHQGDAMLSPWVASPIPALTGHAPVLSNSSGTHHGTTQWTMHSSLAPPYPLSPYAYADVDGGTGASHDRRSGGPFSSRPSLAHEGGAPRPLHAVMSLGAVGGGASGGVGGADALVATRSVQAVGGRTSVRRSSHHLVPAGRVSSKDLAAMTGMLAGDPFLVSVAPHYRFCTDPLTPDLLPVEEGVNAGCAAAQAGGEAAQGGDVAPQSDPQAPGPLPVQLSMAEVQQEIELMAHGMVDRGATAVVFKCRWRSRFGPKALLAIKCMRDPFSYSAQHILESFTFEAEVLAKCRHPNIVRMYGAALEPPVCCIIMELLPSSLKDRVHGPTLRLPLLKTPTAPSPFPARSRRCTVHDPLALSLPDAHGPLLRERSSAHAPATPKAAAPHARRMSLHVHTAARFSLADTASLQLDVERAAAGAAPAMRLGSSDTRHTSSMGADAAQAGAQQPRQQPGAGAERAAEEGSSGAGARATRAPTAPSPLPSPIPSRVLLPPLPPSGSGGSPGGNGRGGVARARLPSNASEAVATPVGASAAAGLGLKAGRGNSVGGASDPSLELGDPSGATRGGDGVGADEGALRRVWRESASAALSGDVLDEPAKQEEAGQAQQQQQQRRRVPRQMSQPELAQMLSAARAQPLQQPAEPPPQLSPLEVVSVGADIAAGLAHLHSPPQHRQPASQDDGEAAAGEDVDELGPEDGLARVVHRDLKPANILVNSRGHAKISDFGLAREHHGTTVYTQHFGAGTLSYMAPELLKGSTASPSLTDKVDIYALGIMLWELATRQLPWRGCSDVQVQALVTSGQRPPMPSSLATARASSASGAPPSRGAVPPSSPAAGPFGGGAGRPTSSGSAAVANGGDASSSPGTLLGAASASAAPAGAGVGLPPLPAAGDDALWLLQQLPALASLIRACWQPKPHRRPTAAAVGKALLSLASSEEMRRAMDAWEQARASLADTGGGGGGGGQEAHDAGTGPASVGGRGARQGRLDLAGSQRDEGAAVGPASSLSRQSALFLDDMLPHKS